MSDSKTKTDYDQNLQKLLKGDLAGSSRYCMTARKELEFQSDLESEIRLLLVSWRLSLKSGFDCFDDLHINVDQLKSMELKAELCFVRGMIGLHLKDSSFALKQFLLAADLYLSIANLDRWLLSRFNAYISLTDVQGPGDGRDLSLGEIIKDCEEHRQRLSSTFVLGLSYRQRSYEFFEQKKYSSALLEAKKSTTFLKSTVTSDYHLALIHLADCYFELKQLERSKSLIEMLPEGIDARALMPRSLVLAKLNQDDSFDPQIYRVKNPHWMKRFEDWKGQHSSSQATLEKNYQWSLGSGVFTLEFYENNGKLRKHLRSEELCCIRSDSLEARVLLLLQQKPSSRYLLTEILWPELASTESLEDRFHRMMSRLKKKVPHLIVYKNNVYALQFPLILLR